MAKQRTNWLRSMSLVEKQGGVYELTAEGEQFVSTAVETWADTEWTSTGPDVEFTAGTYETVTYARAVDPEFRATVLSRYGTTCPVSGVDHAGLLDVAHVLPWSDHPEHRADLANVLPLSKTHHAAFDRGLFTIDGDCRLRLNPSFETESDVLRRTIVDQAGERIIVPDGGVDPGYFEKRNSALDWF
jgi:putative restriction endonuclease